MFLLRQLTPVFVFLSAASLSCDRGSPASSMHSTGIVCRFTKEAGLVFNQETSDVIQAVFRHASFPNIEGKKSVLLLGTVSYIFKNLQINNMSVEKSDADLSDEKGILISIQDVAVAFKGTMNYAYSNWLLNLNHSLDFQIESQTDLNLALTLACDNGRIAVTISDCLLNFDKLVLKIQKHKEASWIQRLFTDFVSFTLRHIVKGQICTEIHKMANLLADFTLYQAALFIQDGEIASSIELTTDPVITSGYIESRHKGSVSYKNSSVSQKPSAIPVERVETRMFNLWVSEPVINSLLFAAYQDDRLTLKLTDSDLLKLFEDGGSKNQPNILQQMIPGVPMRNLMIKLGPLRPPVILFKRPGTIMQASIYVEVDVLSSNNDSHIALYLEMDSETIVLASYAERKIHLQPSSSLWAIKVVNSNPAITLNENKAKRYLEAFFSTGGLEKIISYIEFYVTALLDKKGLRYFNITNTLMETDEGYVTIATDFGFPRHLLENFLQNLTPMARS
ncbi:cholesteryl ester transfer protein isoform X1 [Carcharodon carcharias]|uniref:cholesteryl ester transfer protein isoform X1 n=2 Tax=Carcharodon carcharias TaxID=13397 RepID=UPI001B7E6DC0|nr:cholesteryl ester transfer protein isoform X1 [Carcharodon carcharias]